MSVAEDYFRLDYLENDPVELINWLTDYGTQKLVTTSFDGGYQAFYRGSNNEIFVHKKLLLYYRIWFDIE